jgi:hypothetical protein
MFAWLCAFVTERVSCKFNWIHILQLKGMFYWEKNRYGIWSKYIINYVEYFFFDLKTNKGKCILLLARLYVDVSKCTSTLHPRPNTEQFLSRLFILDLVFGTAFLIISSLLHLLTILKLIREILPHISCMYMYSKVSLLRPLCGPGKSGLIIESVLIWRPIMILTTICILE